MTGPSALAVRRGVHCGFVVALIAPLGCGGSDKAGKADLPAPMVTIAPPVERMVTRYESATGRTAPLEQVEIRARVSGYLAKIHFEPGREVEKGQPLFEIDSEPYKADLARAKAGEETAKADLATGYELDIVAETAPVAPAPAPASAPVNDTPATESHKVAAPKLKKKSEIEKSLL